MLIAATLWSRIAIPKVRPNPSIAAAINGDSIAILLRFTQQTGATQISEVAIPTGIERRKKPRGRVSHFTDAFVNQRQLCAAEHVCTVTGMVKGKAALG